MDHLTFRRILCEELLMGQRPAAKPSKRKSDSSTAPGGDLRLAGHEHLKFQKGKKWKQGRFVPYHKNRQVKGEIQKVCPDCDKYTKVTRHCECDGSRGMCKAHWAIHVSSILASSSHS